MTVDLTIPALTLEACVDSAESAVAADRGGADRFELCQNLIIGGTTPSPGLFHQVQSRSDLPIRVLIRPRFGDFLYSADELEIMLRDIRFFREHGAAAVVTGVLTADGQLDLEAMKRLREAAGSMDFVLHRAIDVAADPFAVLDHCLALDVCTILTSGQAQTALDGLDMLRNLAAYAAGRIEILAGAGVSAVSIPALHAAGIYSYHMSGKTTSASSMRFRRLDVSMGLPGISEFDLIRADEDAFHAAKSVIASLQ